MNARLSDTIPQQASTPAINPTIIRSHYAPTLYRWGIRIIIMIKMLLQKRALKVHRLESKPILSVAKCFTYIVFDVKENDIITASPQGNQDGKRVG